MRIILYSLFFLSYLSSIAQTLKQITIEDCYSLAIQHYPASKQKELIEKSKEYSVSNAFKSYFPQLLFAGQATYQSDVTTITLPFTIPGFEIETPDKDQYRIYGEINQSLTDFFTVKHQINALQTNAQVEEQKIDVELYKIKERINQIFFGILLLNEQLKQIELLKKDIQNGITKTEAAIKNGVSLKSSLYVLEAEKLKINQKIIEANAAKKSYLEMLGLLTSQALDEHSILIQPAVTIINHTINRPELTLIDFQSKLLDMQNHLLTVKNYPRVGLFFQEGYGRPTLNMLDNDFNFYYIGGIRFNWSLSGFYTLKKERQILTINKDILSLQKETFLLNTNLALRQQNNEITKLEELIKADEEIISLRAKVKETANVQLENGIITSNDYIREVNAEDQARQNLLLHKIQLLMVQYTYQTTVGN